MRASSHQVADGSVGLRASDAERDHAVGELRSRFAEGRLSQETFIYRMDAALRAKDRSELTSLFADLPGPAHRSRPGRALGARLAALARMTGLASVRRRPAEVRAVPPPPRVMVAVVEPTAMRLPRQEGDGFTIGRASGCDFTVADESVSRWHARLERQDDGWVLRDLGSTNGTRLNGWRVTAAVPVGLGDEVTFGSVTYVIADRGVSASQAI